MAFGYRRRYGGGFRRRYGGGYNNRPATRTVYVRAPVKRRKRRTVKRRKVMAKPKAKALTRFEVAQVNPFHQDAIGCKIPDANSMPSCCVQMLDTATMTTDAVFGGAVMAFRPYPTGVRVSGASVASATTWTWAAAFGNQTNSTRLSSITGNFSLVRPVAHGIRLTSALSPNTVTGFVHIGIFASDIFNVTTWDFPANVSDLSNIALYKKIPLALLCGKSATIVNRTVDFSSERYFDPASDLVAQGSDISFQTTGWGTIIVFVEGASVATGALQVEMLTHLEAIPLKTGLADASAAARYSPATIGEVTDFVNRSDPVVVSDQNEDGVAHERSGGFFSGVLDAANEYASGNRYEIGQQVFRLANRVARRYAAGGGGYETRGIYTGNLALLNQ